MDTDRGVEIREGVVEHSASRDDIVLDVDDGAGGGKNGELVGAAALVAVPRHFERALRRWKDAVPHDLQAVAGALGVRFRGHYLGVDRDVGGVGVRAGGNGIRRLRSAFAVGRAP